jgi:hypothetical protein
LKNLETRRKRLEIQGFFLSDNELIKIGPWLRLTYIVCGLFMLAGTILASPLILWILGVIALMGAILPFHPFDLIYNYGIRYLTGTGKFPPSGPPRRFACGIAAVWVTVMGICFANGYMLTGYILGGMIIFLVTLVSITNICIPSMTYRALFGWKDKPHGNP